MPIYTLRLFLFLTALFLCACGGGPREVRVTQGSEQVGNAPTGTLVSTSSASIVHVDLSERIATMRRGNSFTDGQFLQSIDKQGQQTGILKAQDKKPTGLRTAFILEGEPQINDVIRAVSAAESARLAQIYPEAEEE